MKVSGLFNIMDSQNLLFTLCQYMILVLNIKKHSCTTILRLNSFQIKQMLFGWVGVPGVSLVVTLAEWNEQSLWNLWIIYQFAPLPSTNMPLYKALYLKMVPQIMMV